MSTASQVRKCLSPSGKFEYDMEENVVLPSWLEIGLSGHVDPCCVMLTSSLPKTVDIGYFFIEKYEK